MTAIGLLILIAGVAVAVVAPVRGPVKGMIVCFAMAGVAWLGAHNAAVLGFTALGIGSAVFGRSGD